MVNPRTLFYAVITALITNLLAACGTEPAYPLRIGINPWPGYEFLFLAEEKGFFEQRGVDVGLVEFVSLGDVRRGFERNQIDGMASTLIEVLQARYQSPRLPKVILIADYSNGADVILARDPVKTVAELRGQRVATEIASVGIFLLSRALEQNGMTLEDVVVVPMDQTELAGALRKNQVQAVVTYPPMSVPIARDRGINTIFSSAEIPNEIVDVISLDNKILENRLDDVQRLILAWDDALRYAARYPDESYRIMAYRQGIEPEEFRRALEDIQVVSSSEQRHLFGADEGLIQTVRKLDTIMRGAGLISGPDRSADTIVAEPILTLAQ